MAALGANRNIYEATVGYWYRLVRGGYGRIEQGNQIVHMHRDLWGGTGRTPQGADIVGYTSLRFYLPKLCRLGCAAVIRAPMFILQWIIPSVRTRRKRRWAVVSGFRTKTGPHKTKSKEKQL
jgi:hypothetical protein